MDRRTFVAVVGGSVVVALLPVEGQPAKVPRIGVMAPGSPPPESSPPIVALVQGLQELGWVPGQNITLEYRWTEDREDRYPEFARDLVRVQVDVIVASTATAIRAAKQATTSIPIVMASTGFPVESGLIASLARPGGNVTGVATLTVELVGKRLDCSGWSPLTLRASPFSMMVAPAAPMSTGHSAMPKTPRDLLASILLPVVSETRANWKRHFRHYRPKSCKDSLTFRPHCFVSMRGRSLISPSGTVCLRSTAMLEDSWNLGV